MRKYIGLAIFCLAATPLHAGELPAMAGESIDLGGFRGVVYYMSEHDGYRVVATLAEVEAGLPVRFSATLAENQSLTISMPGKLGEPSQALEISRVGDKLILAKAARAAERFENARTQAMAE
jgi:hypothetical protein